MQKTKDPFSFKKLVTSLPVQLVIVITFGLLGSHFLSHDLMRFFLALSLSLKSILLFVLPLIIFSCVFGAISGMPKGALLFIFFVISGLCLSNFTSTLIAYNASRALISPVMSFSKTQALTETLQPLWVLSLPTLIKNDIALLLGLALGILVSYRRIEFIIDLGKKCSQISMLFLNRFFVPALPIFIFGFILKLSYDQIIIDVLKQNFISVLSILLVLFFYISLLYMIGARFSLNQFTFYFRNMIPPIITAFSTMSSAATLPLSLQAAEQNAGRKDTAQAMIPATVNIHLMGDSISIPMMAIIILASFGRPFPELSTYLVFAFYFVMAKFAVAAVPGGGILVMVPILERFLGFTGEMSALITALYILLDPVITTANVLGNNIYCVLFTQLLNKISGTKVPQKAFAQV